jgi:hypothetical protein
MVFDFNLSAMLQLSKLVHYSINIVLILTITLISAGVDNYGSNWLAPTEKEANLEALLYNTLCTHSGNTTDGTYDRRGINSIRYQAILILNVNAYFQCCGRRYWLIVT